MVKNLAVIAGLSLLIGCATATSGPVLGSAELKDKDGKTVGIATFREATGGVLMIVEAKGLTPGLHAVHVHAVGKMRRPGIHERGRPLSIRCKKSMATRTLTALMPATCPICWSLKTARGTTKFLPTESLWPLERHRFSMPMAARWSCTWAPTTT